MFLLKKPKWLEFVKEIYDPIVSKAARRQIRHTGEKTNAKIIKMKSGEMYIKVGKDLYLLKPSNLPIPFKILESNNGKYTHKHTVDTKYFINEIKK